MERALFGGGHDRPVHRVRRLRHRLPARRARLQRRERRLQALPVRGRVGPRQLQPRLEGKPGVARTKEDIIASAGSRYTYSANTMAYDEAIESGAERLALVGMSCQSSVPPVMNQRRAGKVGRRMALNIGLLCSKTFDDAIFEELLEAKYGLKRAEIKKMNIKGRLQIWMHDGRYVEVPLKECHAFTREGCKLCPDFAAEHADISTGGIGAFNDWTLTLVRTDVGREIMEGLERDGWIEGRGADEDLGALELLHKLAKKQRARWPEFAHIDAPRLVGA